MSIAELPQLPELSVDQRLQLIGTLWDSIVAEDPHDVPALDDDELALLDARIARHETNPSAGITLDELKQHFGRQK